MTNQFVQLRSHWKCFTVVVRGVLWPRETAATLFKMFVNSSVNRFVSWPSLGWGIGNHSRKLVSNWVLILTQKCGSPLSLLLHVGGSAAACCCGSSRILFPT